MIGAPEVTQVNKADVVPMLTTSLGTRSRRMCSLSKP